METAMLTPDRAPAQMERLDKLEAAMLATAAMVELPLTHRFTPGLYAREIFMPAGTLLTSRIHKTEHPYVVLSGKVSVYIPGVGVEHFEAPFVGVTKPYTRRVLYIHEDCRWVTFHPLTDEESAAQDVDLIEARIIERRELADGMTAFEHYSLLLEEGRRALLPGDQDFGGAP